MSTFTGLAACSRRSRSRIRSVRSANWSKPATSATSGSPRSAQKPSAGRMPYTLRELAEEKGATAAQLAIVWVLSRGDDIVPLVGARRRERLTEALGALEVELSADDLARIEQAIPAGAAAGERYQAPQMATLDSERG
jgi:aryl-alcohol dehydrogenase-like predicted oxidoreductase